jgi:hypothetical protein
MAGIVGMILEDEEAVLRVLPRRSSSFHVAGPRKTVLKVVP